MRLVIRQSAASSRLCSDHLLAKLEPFLQVRYILFIDYQIVYIQSSYCSGSPSSLKGWCWSRILNIRVNEKINTDFRVTCVNHPIREFFILSDRKPKAIATSQ